MTEVRGTLHAELDLQNIEMTPENIAASLRNRHIFPSMLLCYLAASLQRHDDTELGERKLGLCVQCIGQPIGNGGKFFILSNYKKKKPTRGPKTWWAIELARTGWFFSIGQLFLAGCIMLLDGHLSFIRRLHRVEVSHRGFLVGLTRYI